MPATLADLPADGVATLESVGGERAYRRRLLELGFVPGTEVKVIRRVEVGDVLEVELRLSRVSLRISEARVIALTGGPEPAQSPSSEAAGEGTP